MLAAKNRRKSTQVTGRHQNPRLLRASQADKYLHLSMLATQKSTSCTTKTTQSRPMLPNKFGTLRGKPDINTGNSPQMPKCTLRPPPRRKNKLSAKNVLRKAPATVPQPTPA